MPVDLVFGFLVGVFITSHAPPLCRFLLSDARAEREARARACSAFLDRGMSRKKGRTGILVFVSTFERVVVWLPDIGIDTEALGEDFRAQEKAAERAVARHDFDAFVEALRALGPPLGRALPHHADDLNELPDEVVES
jgi:putative membrane protein